MDKPSGSGNSYHGKRVVVLGASGFIGRWVARALSEESAQLYLVVRNKKVSYDLLADGIQGDVVQADLRDLSSVDSLLRSIRPVTTFNVAGYGVDPSERDETTAYQINANLVRTICEAIAKIQDPEWRGQDIVHVGTALEYGAVGGDLSEDSHPCPTTLYGKSKLSGTWLLERCCKMLDIKGLTARLFTVYGPGERKGRLLPALIDTARTGNSLPLTVGSQERDFTYVGDAADGLLRLGVVSEASPGEVVNLATGKLSSVRHFVEIAAGVLRIPTERLSFGAIPTRDEEMQHDDVSLERLRRLLAWIPPTSIEEGIRKTLLREGFPSSPGDKNAKLKSPAEV